MREKLIIAIDGPVGSGKSTAARRVAELLGYTYIDTGAMYRALGLAALRRGVPFEAEERLAALAEAARIELRFVEKGQQVLLDGEDVTGEIRKPEASLAASKIAAIPGVRKVLVAKQRAIGAKGGVVMEGRDIGTVVFPDAGLKVYLSASPEVRAERRWREHHGRGEQMDRARLLAEIRERDQRDRGREASPLVRAPDAVLVDSTAMEAEEVARLIVLLAESRAAAGAAR